MASKLWEGEDDVLAEGVLQFWVAPLWARLRDEQPSSRPCQELSCWRNPCSAGRHGYAPSAVLLQCALCDIAGREAALNGAFESTISLLTLDGDHDPVYKPSVPTWTCRQIAS